MAALICGALAYDTLMAFDGRFADHLLPDALHRLNVSFQAPRLRREFGGCAGNIAHGLRQLGGTPVPVATLGHDGADYLAHLRRQGIATEGVRQRFDAATAQAVVTTDLAHNQITVFHPGAMASEPGVDLPARGDIAIASVSPDQPGTMLRHAQALQARGIPFVFDPGQATTQLDRADLQRLTGCASWMAVNAYEADLLGERLGLDCAALSRRLRGVVVTDGDRGCVVWVDGVAQALAAEPAHAVLDPTGCGDAFRSALLYGLERGWSLSRSAALGNRIGAVKVASQGAQNYRLDLRGLAMPPP